MPLTNGRNEPNVFIKIISVVFALIGTWCLVSLFVPRLPVLGRGRTPKSSFLTTLGLSIVFLVGGIGGILGQGKIHPVLGVSLVIGLIVMEIGNFWDTYMH